VAAETAAPPPVAIALATHPTISMVVTYCAARRKFVHRCGWAMKGSSHAISSTLEESLMSTAAPTASAHSCAAAMHERPVMNKFGKRPQRPDLELSHQMNVR
jgi:hypothetical protein